MNTESGPTPSEARDIVVIGASSGGVGVIADLLGRLPSTIPAAIFVVLHLGKGYRGDMAGLLSRDCALPVSFATDGELIVKGHVYIAPGDENMSLESGRIVVQASPRESYHRPSINALFRSAAQAYGRRVLGVVLTGILEDGAAGAWEIWRHGGVVIVQDPTEAPYAELPKHVIDTVPVDYCVRLSGIADLIENFATRPRRALPLGDSAARVLIVEDERIVAKSLEQELQALHYQVCATAMSGEAAVEAAERTRPDVVLMDIRLTGSMDGTQAAALIWERLQIPVVYLTAYADAATLTAIKRTNAYGYVMKPCEPSEVHIALQLALERRDRESIT